MDSIDTVSGRRAPHPPLPTADEFVRRYWSEEESLPKHARLTRAFTRAIDEGFWAPGARLPTEVELVATTPCSLGTVQRALRDLATAGIITRRQGSGTIVSEPERPIERPWHMRFFDEGDGRDEPLPVYTSVLERRVVRGRGPWSEPLDARGAEAVRIDRIFTVNERFRAYSIFHALCERFPDLLEGSLDALDGQNIKMMIARRHGLPVHRVRQGVSFRVPTKRIASKSDCAAGVAAMVLTVVAYDLGGSPMYHQQFYVPPNDYRLDFGMSGFG